jgi:DNA-binding NtrC family response regulator
MASFRLLCVDDDPAMLRMLALGFSNSGIEVVTASQGIDALMQFSAQEGRFDALLVDTDMDKMDGPTFVKRVRELGYQGRILVMSGRLTSRACQEYIDQKITGFLTKPFEINMVATLLLEAQ